MEFDAVELDALITTKHLADYWRERAECLEEWVCELLRKNQALRMRRENDQSQQHGRTMLSFSPLSLDQLHLSSRLPSFCTSSFGIDVGTESSCPRKECAEIRESVTHNAVMNRLPPQASKLKG